jgi:hypothetical protein
MIGSPRTETNATVNCALSDYNVSKPGDISIDSVGYSALVEAVLGEGAQILRDRPAMYLRRPGRIKSLKYWSVRRQVRSHFGQVSHPNG